MRVGLLIVVLSLGACLQSGVHHCEDGSLCGTDRVCSPRGGCVLPDQLAACDGLPDETVCTLASITMGACYDGVCLPVGCGNGIVEPGEACDDGNVSSGDGCSGRCDSTETCGNAFLDVSLGEQCDCGGATLPDEDRPPGCTGPNADDAGSLCRADCTFVGCGDGVASGLEECDGDDIPRACTDLGFYGGALACLPSCRFDVEGCKAAGYCGDSTRNGPSGKPLEVCDGSDLGGLSCTDLGFYTAAGLGCNPACLYDTTGCHDRCGDGLVNGPETCDGAPAPGLSCITVGKDAGQLSCATSCYDTFTNCRDVGFVPEYSGSVPSALSAVWGQGTEFFACGTKGVSRTTGGSWSVMAGSPQLITCDVWGTSPTDVWVAGSKTTSTTSPLYHWDGSTWTPVSGVIATLSSLTAVHAVSSSSVYATVGNRIFHYTGTWQELTTTLPAISIQDIWASSADDIFVVGMSGARYHWNGSTWVDQSSGITNFTSVSGRSATEVYTTRSSATEVFDGNTWTPLSGGCFPEAVTVAPDGRVFQVGTEVSYANVSCVAQRFGTRFVRLPIDSIGRLTGVAASDDRIYVVSAEAMLRSDGAAWVLPSAPPIREALDLWVGGYTAMYAVGGDDIALSGRLAYFNGTSWTSIAVDSNWLYGVWSTETSTVAVGQNGTIWHGTATSFSLKNTPVSETLLDVWGTGGVFYAVGANGTLLRYSGTGNNWSKETSPTTQSMSGVFGLTATDVYAVGAGGTVLHRDASSWTTMSVPTTVWISDVWARSATDVYAVGDAGTILHYDGASWSPMQSGVTFNLTSVWGTGDVTFVSGTVAGTTLMYQGGRWLPFSQRTSVAVREIAGDGTLTVFLTDTVDVLSGLLFAPDATEVSCSDLWDDDNDGLTDCADADCAGSTACIAPGGCKPIVDVACGATLASTTSGGPQRFPYYGAGCSTKLESAPEQFVRVRRSTPGPIMLQLSGYTGDLDLIVSGRSPQGACIADESCIAASQTTAATEGASFTAAANTDYVVIVDGSAPSSFMLSVTCP